MAAASLAARKRLMTTTVNARRFFVASCLALTVTAMTFAIRAEIMDQLAVEFTLSASDLGWMAGAAFWGFTLAMVFGGPLCDVVGMGRLTLLAFVGHVSGIVLTMLATGFWTLFAATLLVGVGNGLVEAACNPLVATLYPREKTKKLNQFHVWFPGGIVIGGLAAFALDRWGLGWQIKMALMLPLAVAYGLMFLGQKFPHTERVASGVSTRDMFAEVFRPLFLFMVLCMFLTASTELGTNQWIDFLLQNVGVPGILVLAWINGLMAIGRQLVGPVVHRLAPSGMLLFSSVFSAIGLYWLSHASGLTAFAAASVFAIGICYFWPTMLGFVAESLPRSGALGLAVMGGAGNLSVSLALPLMGALYDSQIAAALPQGTTPEVLQAAAAGTAEASVWMHAQLEAGRTTLRYVTVLPVVLIVAFTGLYLQQRGKGPVHLVTSQSGAAEEA